jgi:thioredoxin reductase
MKTSLSEWPVGTPDITTHDVMKDYIQGIAHQYHVDESVRYKTTVQQIEKRGNKWTVHTSAHRRDSVFNSDQLLTRDESFDAVIVATGHYHAPRIPDIPGLNSLKKKFPSQISHSKSYRGAETLAGKNILIIGTGASAIDIARDAAPLAKKVYHSWRSGKFDVPLSMFPEEVIHIGEVINIEDTLGNQQPSSPTAGSISAKFQLVDGSKLCDIDAVVICTGYHISLPFLAPFHDDDLPATTTSEDIIITDGTMYHNLHKDIFYIPDPSLIFVGVPYYTANFSLFDFQAQAVAAVLAGFASLPSKAERREEYNKKLAEKGAGKQFHSLRGTEVEYVHELLDWVNPQLVSKEQPPLMGHTPEWLAAKDEQLVRLGSLFGSQAGGNQEKLTALPQEVLCS